MTPSLINTAHRVNSVSLTELWDRLPDEIQVKILKYIAYGSTDKWAPTILSDDAKGTYSTRNQKQPMTFVFNTKIFRGLAKEILFKTYATVLSLNKVPKAKLVVMAPQSVHRFIRTIDLKMQAKVDHFKYLQKLANGGLDLPSLQRIQVQIWTMGKEKASHTGTLPQLKATLAYIDSMALPFPVKCFRLNWILSKSAPPKYHRSYRQRLPLLRAIELKLFRKISDNPPLKFGIVKHFVEKQERNPSSNRLVHSWHMASG